MHQCTNLLCTPHSPSLMTPSAGHLATKERPIKPCAIIVISYLETTSADDIVLIAPIYVMYSFNWRLA